MAPQARLIGILTYKETAMGRRIDGHLSVDCDWLSRRKHGHRLVRLQGIEASLSEIAEKLETQRERDVAGDILD